MGSLASVGVECWIQCQTEYYDIYLVKFVALIYL